MEKQQTPRSIHLIYFIINLFFWLTAVISIIALFVLGYITFGGNLSGEISFGTGHVYENFNEVPTSLKAGFFLGTLTILSSILIIFFYFKRFMKLVYDGRYFDLKTIKNLKMISYFLTVVFLAEIIIGITISVFSETKIFDKIQSEDANVTFTIDAPSFEIIFVALIFWVLSHIFMEGAKLKEANDLTI
mgnify:CR=1 FL=1